MFSEKQRQKYTKDLDEKDEEIEELRCSVQKKVIIPTSCKYPQIITINRMNM